MKKHHVFILSIILSLIVSNLYAGKLSGVVTNQDSQPVANANVTAFGFVPSSGDSLFEMTTTNENGQFSFDQLVSGTYFLHAQSSQGQTNDYTGPFEIESSSDITDVQLTIHEVQKTTGTVSGQVKTENDTPISRVTLELVRQATDSKSFRAYTGSNENGNFSFPGVLAGEYKLSAYHPQGFKKEYENIITVEANQEITDIVVIYTQDDLEFGSVSGAVKTDAGLPLEGVTVKVKTLGLDFMLTDSSIYNVLTTVTDAEGRYSFAQVVPGNCWITSNHPVGGVIQVNDVVVVGSQATTVADIIYPASEIVSGTVTGTVMIGSNGKPAIGARLEFIQVGPDSTFSNSAPLTTDNSGQYTATLSPGKYIVQCQYFDTDVDYFFQYYENTKDMASATEIAVIAEQTVENIDFNIPEPLVLPEVTISGQVTDEQGSPLQGAVVDLIFQPVLYSFCYDSLMLDDATTTTDADGKYSFLLKNVKSPVTKIVVSATVGGYLREFYNDQKEYYLADVLVPGELAAFENIDFTLSKEPAAVPYTISGAVTDETGAAIAGAEVTAYHANDYCVVSTRTNSDGEYELENLYEGNYVVQFYAPGFIPEFYDNKENWELADQLTPNQSLVNVNAALTSFEADSSLDKILGQVTDGDGTALGGVLVTVKNGQGKTVGFDFSDSNGSYRIEGIKNGQLTVDANRVQYKYKSDALNLSASKSATKVYHISLEKAGATSSIAAGVEQKGLPANLELKGNYPNPFNPETTIRFSLSQPARVTVKIYNIVGQEVTHLTNGRMEAGFHSLKWAATNNLGAKVQSGVYFYQITAFSDNNTKTMKIGRMILIK